MYSYKQAYNASVRYFGNDLSAKAFVDKYALKDNDDNFYELTPNDMHTRIASELARIESAKFSSPLTQEEILSYLGRFAKIIPQGSPMYGIGNPYSYVSLSNCFVIHKPEDSYGGILYTDQQIVQISKRRGGVGISLDNLRPQGLATKNAAKTTTGILSWMERYSNSIREVGQHGRRGAMMLTLNVHHPQILDFIQVKRDISRITGANISVQYTDEFLSAVEQDLEYEQRWPVDSKTPVISNMVRARDIWKEVVHSSWACAEPGLQFWDSTIRESIPDCYSEFGFKSVTSNPCSEIILSILDSCRLLTINLFAYVKYPYTENAYFDYNEFYYDAQVAQRLMDDIVDLELECIDRIISKINSDPEEQKIKEQELDMWRQIRVNCVNGRRTGTGITALGDTLAAINIKYGTEESITTTEEIYKTLKFGVYRASVDIANEIGPFPVWNWELEKDNPFLNRIVNESILGGRISGESLIDDMKLYGRRNIACLTTAPTGTVSTQASLSVEHEGKRIYVHGTTSGIEPAYKLTYTRRKKGNPNDVGFRVDFIDQNGDSWMEFDVDHPGLYLWKLVNPDKPMEASPYYKATAEDIDWINRVKLQAAAQKHICHSISSTINLPESATEKEVNDIYMEAWKSGLKGITVYRDNCRTGVLISKDTKKIPKSNSPKRPKELPCDIHHISVLGHPYVIAVGLFNEEPYEVFAGDNGQIGRHIKEGKLVKTSRPKGYKLILSNGEEIALDSLSNPEQEALMRMSSMALRHGADIVFIVDQLNKTKGDLTSFAKGVARALKKYVPDGLTDSECPECNSKLHREDGCLICKSCAWSKCG